MSWMLRYDPISLAVAGLAGGLLIAAWRVRARRLRLAVALVVLAGGILRADGAWQRSLHEWDERFHALVARHLTENPLEPVLYRTPALEYDVRDWTRNHVWLHKPPLALWGMAASMRVFGVGELSMRLPSVLFSSAAVALTFLIGRRLFGDRVGLLAASFHAANGFLIALAAGRRVADHVDTALVFCFELSVWFALAAARSPAAAALCGVAVGFGLLAKSLPALLALAPVFVSLLATVSWRTAIARTAAIAGVALAVAAPWTIYSWWRFPVEAAWESRYTLMHLSQSLEASGGGPFSYVRDLPRFFGELTPLSLALAAWCALTRGMSPALALPAVWIGVPYALFSVAATRMPAFIMVSAPAIFIVHAWAWWQFRDRSLALTGASSRAMLLLLVLMAASPVRYLFEPTGVLERRDRRPAAVEELRGLEAALGPGEVVLFNMPLPIEAMFYSPYTAYEEMPTEAQARALAAAGRRVVIYQPAADSTSVPAGWPVSYLKGGIRKSPREEEP